MPRRCCTTLCAANESKPLVGSSANSSGGSASTCSKHVWRQGQRYRIIASTRIIPAFGTLEGRLGTSAPPFQRDTFQRQHFSASTSAPALQRQHFSASFHSASFLSAMTISAVKYCSSSSSSSSAPKSKGTAIYSAKECSAKKFSTIKYSEKSGAR